MAESLYRMVPVDQEIIDLVNAKEDVTKPGACQCKQNLELTESNRSVLHLVAVFSGVALVISMVTMALCIGTLVLSAEKGVYFDPWDAINDYGVGDVVLYDSALYVAVTSTEIGVPPTSLSRPSPWKRMVSLA